MFHKLIQKTMKLFASHIKVLGGPHVARGPDVAQACPKLYLSFMLVQNFELTLAVPKNFSPNYGNF
jgi:hypothetical protein